MSKPAANHAPGEKDGVSACGMSEVRIDKRKKPTCKKCAKALAKQRSLTPITQNDKWTEMQLAFARHPRVMLNAEQAMIEVGYSKRYAKNNAHSLRKRMMDVIQKVQQKAEEKQVEKAGITQERVREEMASLAFANVADYFKVLPDGRTRPKMISELTREQSAAIKEFELTVFEDQESSETIYVISSLKLVDKRQSLVDLGKVLGMFIKRISDETPKKKAAQMLESVPTEELEKVEKYLLSKAADVNSEHKKRTAFPGDFTELQSGGE